MNKQLLLAVIMLLTSTLQAKDYTISGYISDAQSSETLIGASVIDTQSGKGAVTNPYGFYSLTLREGELSLRYSYVGFAVENLDFELKKDTVINIHLRSSTDLKEVTVVGHHAEIGVKGTQMSAVEVSVEQIKAIPSLLGETDVLKALQLLPGVQGGAEGSAGLYVRGGGPDQNLLLLDGVPVYNVNHMFGFFSVFNADAIKNVTLYKGNFPARFGGYLSSVVDIRMKDGDMYKYHGNVSVGLISSKFNLEGPIWKGKTSFNISARRTYFDILTQPIIHYITTKEGAKGSTAGYYFYDLNAKINHKFSDRDRLFLSFYSGDDAIYATYKFRDGYYDDAEQRIKYSEKMKMNWDWGNLVAAVRWNRIINSKLFMNTTASFTRYRFYLALNDTYEEKPNMKRDYQFQMGYRSGIEDYSGKIEFDYLPNPNHEIKFGGNYTYHGFKPAVSSVKATSEQEEPVILKSGDEPIYSHEVAIFAEDNLTITDYLKANIGLHYSGFAVQKRFYHSLQPRVSARLLLTDDLSFKAAYAYMTQYIHMLSNNNISLPTDLWVPVTNRIEPMNSNQYSAGFFYNLKDWIDLSVEGYYKRMDNIIEYKDGASFWGSTASWEEKVSMGRGWSYGVEFLAQRSFGKTTGWLGYTWSKTDRLFNRPDEEINFGEVFPAKYDRRHDLSLVVSHKLNDRIDFSGTWVYSSGNAGTLEMQVYEAGPTPHSEYGQYLSSLPYIPSRNNFRYPDYHRLDLGVNFHKQKKYGVRTWNISIYNVYNRMNPFIVITDSNYDYETDKYEEKLKSLTLFPIIPSISYSYKF